jgi:hypothetical protein
MGASDKVTAPGIGSREFPPRTSGTRKLVIRGPVAQVAQSPSLKM